MLFEVFEFSSFFFRSFGSTPNEAEIDESPRQTGDARYDHHWRYFRSVICFFRCFYLITFCFRVYFTIKIINKVNPCKVYIVNFTDQKINPFLATDNQSGMTLLL